MYVCLHILPDFVHIYIYIYIPAGENADNVFDVAIVFLLESPHINIEEAGDCRHLPEFGNQALNSTIHINREERGGRSIE